MGKKIRRFNWTWNMLFSMIVFYARDSYSAVGDNAMDKTHIFAQRERKSSVITVATLSQHSVDEKYSF